MRERVGMRAAGEIQNSPEEKKNPPKKPAYRSVDWSQSVDDL